MCRPALSVLPCGHAHIVLVHGGLDSSGQLLFFLVGFLKLVVTIIGTVLNCTCISNSILFNR